LVADVPNATLGADHQFARLGFMSPADVEAFVGYLEERGLCVIQHGRYQHVAVVD
jgi:hypothetical protein